MGSGRTERFAAWVGVVGLLGVGAAIAPPASAVPAPLVVTTTADVVDGDDGVLSLREAVDQANANAGADAVQLADAATYVLSRCDVTVGSDEDLNVTGDLDVSEELEVLGAGAEVQQSCVGDETPSRVVHAHGAAPLTLRHATLAGGRTPVGADPGASVLVESAASDALTLEAVAVLGSSGDLTREVEGLVEDAAVAVPAGSLLASSTTVADNADAAGVLVGADSTIVDSAIEGNHLEGGRAAGIIVRGGTLIVEGTTLSGNTTRRESGVAGRAGAIESAGTVELVDTQITGNVGALAGGVLARRIVAADTTFHANEGTVVAGGFRGAVEFDRVTVTENIAPIVGGGLVGPDGAGPQHLADSTLSDNESTLAGALYVGSNDEPTDLTIERSTVTANSGGSTGGVLAVVEDGDATVDVAFEASTIVDGVVGPSGESTSPATDVMAIGSSVTWRSSAIGSPGAEAPSCRTGDGGTFTSLGGNVAADASCGVGDESFDAADVGDLGLLPLADGAGPTWTRVPVAASPLAGRIPGGSPLCGAVDQRGVPRPQGPACDSGSVEIAEAPVAPPTIVVTSTDDVLDAEDGVLGLREAVQLANASAGPDTIELAEGVTYDLVRCDPVDAVADDDTNATGDLDVLEALTVVGNRAAIEQTCDGGVGSPSARLWHGIGSAVLMLGGVSLLGGRTPAGGDTGAAVRVESASATALTFDDVIVSGAVGGPPPLGDAAVDVVGGGALTDSTIEGTTSGSGLRLGAGGTIDGSIIRQNAGGLEGAGIDVLIGDLEVTDTEIVGNGIEPSRSGSGGVSVADGEVALTNSVVADNVGVYAGGVVARRITATDSIIRDNVGGFEGGGFQGAVDFTRVAVLGNQSAAYGGGGYVLAYGENRIRDSTIAGNSAVYGGALTVDIRGTGSLTIERSTITENVGEHIGGIHDFTDPTEPVRPFVIRDSTLAGNTATDATRATAADELFVQGSQFSISGSVIGSPSSSVPDCYDRHDAGEPGDPPVVISLGGNVASDGTCGVDGGADGGIGGGPYDVPDAGDLGLGPLADNGGPTMTRLPSLDSPAVDRVPAWSELCSAMDQRGEPRPNGSGCDTGAVEVPSALPPCTSAPFSDVLVANPFCAEIDFNVRHGLTTGYTDGTFRPMATLSRQAIAAQLFRLAGQAKDPAGCVSVPFVDVPVDHPFCQEIAWLAGEGITTGFPDDTFRPTLPVPRMAFVAFASRLVGPSPLPPCTVPPFTDVPVDHPFCPHIRWASSSGIVNGYADDTFRPTAPLSRQAAASMLHGSWSFDPSEP